MSSNMLCRIASVILLGVSVVEAEHVSTYHLPQGPFTVHEHLFNTRTGAVFRATDRNSNTFALKSFTLITNGTRTDALDELMAFGAERATLLKVTKSVCSPLLDKVAADAEPKDISCDDHHLQVLMGLDVEVLSEEGDKVSAVNMSLSNSRGVESVRTVNFHVNILLPYMAGGRLGDLIDSNPKFLSVSNRYAAFTALTPQIVEAIKHLHKLKIAHLNVDPSILLCSNINCDRLIVSGFGASVASDAIASSPSTVYANELMQPSVRFRQFTPTGTNDTSIDEKVVHAIQQYGSRGLTWDSLRSVDWFGVGGTLYYLVAGNRLYLDDAGAASPKSLVDVVFKALTDRMQLVKESDEKTAETLKKVRDDVAEGLVLIEGLVNIDREQRIDLDSTSRVVQTSSGLRAKKSTMSALQIDQEVGRINSCAAFLQGAHKTHPELDVIKKSVMPAFIQQIC